MKAFRIFVRVVLLFLTAIGGILFGIIAPLIMMKGDILEANISGHHVFVVWIIMGVIGYVLPCLLFVLERTKLAAIFAIIGTIMVLYIHNTMMGFSESFGVDFSGSFLYLIQILVTVVTVLYAFVENVRAAKIKESTRVAPSILGDNNDKR